MGIVICYVLLLCSCFVWIMPMNLIRLIKFICNGNAWDVLFSETFCDEGFIVCFVDRIDDEGTLFDEEAIVNNNKFISDR